MRLLPLLLCLVGLVGSAQTITTFDFTTPVDGCIYGIAVSTEVSETKNEQFPLGGDDALIASGNIKISFNLVRETDPLYGYHGPTYLKRKTESDYMLVFAHGQGAGDMIFEVSDGSTDCITSMQFEFRENYVEGQDNTLKRWTCDCGTIGGDNYDLWTGDSQKVTITLPTDIVVGNPEPATRIRRIIVTTTSSERTVSDVASLDEFEDGRRIVMNAPLVCRAQSSDRLLTATSDFTRTLYLRSESGLPTLANGDVLCAGVKGTLSRIDGVPCLDVTDESTVQLADDSPEKVTLSSLSDDLLGRMVKVYGGIIAVSADNITLSQGGTAIQVNNLFLSELSATAEGNVEVTGTLGKSAAGYVIHPTSVVVSIYTDEQAMRPDAAHVTVSHGAIEVSGQWSQLQVVSVDGRVVSTNRAVTPCQPGIYVVSVNGRPAAKVAVR
ncbi:MAG: hypothetical protein ACI308_10740 [Muribaculaceae bacterium]